MKRILVPIIASACFLGASSAALAATAAAAEAPKKRGPEVINKKRGLMYLPFQHWKHQTNVRNECFNCHKTTLGKIDNWSKDTAHKICISCHDLEEKGPVQCAQCHKK